MPVIVNLFAELRSEQEARRRDLAMIARQALAASLVLSVVLGAGSWLLSTRAGGMLTRASREWEQVGDTYEELVALNARGVRLEEQGRFLIERAQARILWAPILASIADQVPGGAQVTKLTCERKTVPVQPDPATLVKADRKVPATRAEMDELIRAHTRYVRGVQIFFEGLAYGDRAELIVDAFRTDLQNFSIGEEFDGQVRLGPLGTARLGPASGHAGEVKRFVIDCGYEERNDGGA